MIAAAILLATRLSISPRSSLLLTGSSNIASWRCTATTLNGAMEVAEPLSVINRVIDRIEDGQLGPWMSNQADARFTPPTFELTIPIETLRCSGGRPMEADLRTALHARRHPAIEFRFTDVRGGIEHDIDAQLYRAIIGGQVSLAGTTRDVDINVDAQRVSRDLFRLHAVLPLRMTDFGIVPPRALFGMIRAADQLGVEFNIFLQP